MFGLEFLQGKHNGVVTNSGNNSASNDPKQIPNDANELLIKGAQKAAAGRELGLTEEETLAATSQQYRRQNQRAAYRDRNKRLAEWEQKQKTLRDEGFEPVQMDSDVRFDDDMTEEDRVFGRTDYEMGFRTDLEKEVDIPETKSKEHVVGQADSAQRWRKILLIVLVLRKIPFLSLKLLLNPH